MRLLTPLLFTATLAARTYSVDGVVVAVDPVARTILVSHRPIAHYMPAMLMPFRVANAGDLAGLHPGARVQFDLTIARDRSVASHIRRTGEAALPSSKAPITVPINSRIWSRAL